MFSQRLRTDIPQSIGCDSGAMVRCTARLHRLRARCLQDTEDSEKEPEPAPDVSLLGAGIRRPRKICDKGGDTWGFFGAM